MEILKEFRGTLHGHKIKVCTDLKNLEYENSAAMSQQVKRWTIFLEGFPPKIGYIKKISNRVANAISRMDMGSKSIPHTGIKQQMCFAMRLLTCTKLSKRTLTKSIVRSKDSSDVDSEEPFPLDLENVAHEQNGGTQLQKLVKDKP